MCNRGGLTLHPASPLSPQLPACYDPRVGVRVRVMVTVRLGLWLGFTLRVRVRVRVGVEGRGTVRVASLSMHASI